MEFGTQGDLEARKWARRLTGLTIVPSQTAAEALAAIGQGDELAIVEKSIVAEPYAVAMRRDSAHLLRAINKTLAEMQADGTMEALVDKWLE